MLELQWSVFKNMVGLYKKIDSTILQSRKKERTTRLPELHYSMSILVKESKELFKGWETKF
jgi:hypothetical protein